MGGVGGVLNRRWVQERGGGGWRRRRSEGGGRRAVAGGHPNDRHLWKNPKPQKARVFWMNKTVVYGDNGRWIRGTRVRAARVAESVVGSLVEAIGEQGCEIWPAIIHTNTNTHTHTP